MEGKAILEAEIGCRVRKKADYETKLNRHGTAFKPIRNRVNAEQGVASVSRSFFGRVGFIYR